MDELTVTMEKGDSDVLVVKISGPMTVQYMGDLKTGLLQALESAEQMVVDVSGVTEVDLSGLQLLCAAHRSSLGSEKSLAVDARGCDAFRMASSEAGFIRHVGCLQDKDRTCLWLGGNE